MADDGTEYLQSHLFCGHFLFLAQGNESSKKGRASVGGWTCRNDC